MYAYTSSMEDIHGIICMGLNWKKFLQPSFRNLKQKDYTTKATLCNDIWDYNYFLQLQLLNLLSEPKCCYSTGVVVSCKCFSIPVLNKYHKISHEFI